MKHPQVEGKHEQNEGVEANPEPEVISHCSVLFLSKSGFVRGRENDALTSFAAASRALGGISDAIFVLVFGTLEMPVVHLEADGFKGFQHRRAKRVILGLNQNVRSGCHEMDRHVEGWTLIGKMFDPNPRLIDLKIGLERFQLCFEHFDQGGGRDVVDIGQGKFHDDF
jgi:hypothetical protein